MLSASIIKHFLPSFIKHSFTALAKQVEDKDGNLDSPTSSVKSDRVETYLTNTLTKELKIVQDRLAGKIWVDFGLHYTKSRSSIVRVFAHGAMCRRIDPSWWTHWAISCSSQCSTTGVTKAVVCVILSMEWYC